MANDPRDSGGPDWLGLGLVSAPTLIGGGITASHAAAKLSRAAMNLGPSLSPVERARQAIYSAGGKFSENISSTAQWAQTEKQITRLINGPMGLNLSKIPGVENAVRVALEASFMRSGTKNLTEVGQLADILFQEGTTGIGAIQASLLNETSRQMLKNPRVAGTLLQNLRTISRSPSSTEFGVSKTIEEIFGSIGSIRSKLPMAMSDLPLGIQKNIQAITGVLGGTAGLERIQMAGIDDLTLFQLNITNPSYGATLRANIPFSLPNAPGVAATGTSLQSRQIFGQWGIIHPTTKEIKYLSVQEYTTARLAEELSNPIHKAATMSNPELNRITKDILAEIRNEATYVPDSGYWNEAQKPYERIRGSRVNLVWGTMEEGW